MKFLFLFLLIFSHSLSSEEKSRWELLQEEETLAYERSARIAKFYALDEELREITQELLESQDTIEEIKQIILLTGRRFFVFKYPSGGFQVKGTISFVPDPHLHPLLVMLRGGNRMFGLLHPANIHTCVKNYTVLTTAYRGSVSEGVDEFGGDEVEDVENLLAYLPFLEKKIGFSFNAENIFLLGKSRGGMELVLALARSPYLQERTARAAILTGLLDMREAIRDRIDLKEMFIKDFGLIPGINEDEWIDRRDPLLAVAEIRKDLPLLILQGTNDLRIPLAHGYEMVKKLKEQGHLYDYIEIPGGDHCLDNFPSAMDLITDWLEK